VARSSAWTVDESHDLIEPWLVAIGGIDLDPWCLHRNPIEVVALSHDLIPAGLT
jgi:hypothetical protein